MRHFPFIEFWLGKVYWISKTYKISRVFLRENVLFDETDGTDGMGVDGNQKCPLIFVILRYIKQYTHIYLNILYIKVVRTDVLCALNLGQVGVRIQKLKNTP